MRQDERQVAPTLDGIRADHVNRYRWAAKIINPQSRVIDFACGVGYGTWILANAGHYVRGFDIDDEALAYAKEHYSHDRAAYAKQNGNAPEPITTDLETDAAVCFETVEHLEDPRSLLKALRASAPSLIVSVPNEDVFPFQQDGQTMAYHFRHYTKRDFNLLLQECGWSVVSWWGHKGPESEVERDVNGRTLIAVCRHGEVKAEEKPARHVAILGLGYSVDQFTDHVKRAGARGKFCDEVWAINALGNVFDCDLVFHMDDVRIQEIRAAAKPDSNIAAMLGWLKTSRVPVVTSRAHPDYPALVEFPLEDVLNNLGHDYFNSTAAYAVALAIHTGATKISCFGMDFTYPNRHDAEKGRACVEFWLGQAYARGIDIWLPHNTTLLDSMHSKADRLYGYDTLDVGFDIQADGELKLSFTPRETLPSAEEIEKTYDHSAPIESQHVKGR